MSNGQLRPLGQGPFLVDANNKIKGVANPDGTETLFGFSDDPDGKTDLNFVTPNVDPVTGVIEKVTAMGRDVRLDSGPNIADISSMQARVRKAIYEAIESGGYIGVLGDSTVAPWVDNQPYHRGFAGALLKAIGHAGTLYGPHSQGVVAPVSGTGLNTQIWTLAGKYVFGSLASPLASCTSGSATPPQLGTAVRVFYTNAGSNSTVSIDGGTAEAMPRSGGNTVAVYTKTGLAYGKHTASLSLVSGTDFNVCGIQTYNPGEPSVVNFGAGGAKSSDVYQPGLWYSALNLMKGLAPKVCFIRVCSNDLNQSISAATTLSNNMAIADALNASGILPCFLPICPVSGKDAERAALWASIKQSADAAGYCYADYGDAYWGNTYADASAAGVMMDTLHLNASGQLREMAALKLWLNI